MAEQAHDANNNSQNTQPAANPQMSTKPKEEGFIRSTSEAYVKGVAHQAGEKTVDYESTNGQQQLDAAKAEAQGLWTKYCGCFSSLTG